MKKRMTSLALVLAVMICVVQWGSFMNVGAAAMSSAEALTPFVYQTGEYTALRKLVIYTSGEGSQSTGKSLPKDTKVNVSAVAGEFGKITYSGTTGWINLSYALNPRNKADIPARLAMLRRKFPAGMYWNEEESGVPIPDGYTDQPCQSGHADKRCNYFDGTCQCHGFALKLGYDLFGMHASCWERHYDIDRIMVGDLVRYRSRHTVMITGVYDTYFTVADCNWNYCCNIEWDRKMKKSYISFYEDNVYDGVYHCLTNGGSMLPYTTTQATTTTTKPTTTTTKAATTTTKASTTTTKASTTTTKPTTTTTKAATTTTKAATTTTTKATATTAAARNIQIPTVTKPVLKITSQPKAVTVKEASKATFTVRASGSGLKYQWYYQKKGKTGWTLWKGKTSRTLTAVTIASWNEMKVRCKVTDSTGASLHCSAAKLTVIPKLKITSQPQSITVKKGAKVTFSIKASGKGLQYQWYYRKKGKTAWVRWKGKTSSSFTVTSYASWKGMQVRCKVTDSTGDKLTSAIATVKMK